MTTWSKVITWLLIGVANFQCTTGIGKSVQTEEVNRSLRSIRKAIYYAMENKVVRQSENGRTYFSPAHRPGTNLTRSAYKQPEKAVLAITILGARRPYRVAVVYKIEKLDGGDYEFDRYDMKLARHYLLKLEDYLSSRPEDRDVIDDFRPY